MVNEVVVESWRAFIEEAQNEILPLYKHHEETFDRWGIHGRLHVTRALFFAETMARSYQELGIEVDFTAVRYAAIFHDSGRQGNGRDVWESDSAAICQNHLAQKGDAGYASYVGKLIPKEGENWDINKRIMQDSDVLEIMRPICGLGGIKGFREHHLVFAGSSDPLASIFAERPGIRKQLIQEAWNWILQTDQHASDLKLTNTYIEDLLEILRNNKLSFPLLSIIL